MNTNIALQLMLPLSCSLLIGGLVFGHTGATGIVKERMDAMKDMGDKSKTVADMFKGKAPFEQAAVIDAADAFVLHGKRMLDGFPDTDHSRNGSKTEALPVIWEEWEEFTEHVSEFVSASEALAATARSTDSERSLKVAFFTATKTCSSCHKRFRKPRKQD